MRLALMEEIGIYGKETSVLWMRLAFMDEIGTYGNKGHFLWKKKKYQPISWPVCSQVEAAMNSIMINDFFSQPSQ